MTIVTTETPGATGVPTLLDGVRTGWIARFRDWVAPITEGPEAIFAVGSVEVGLVIGSVAIQYGRRLYPYFLPSWWEQASPESPRWSREVTTSGR